MCILIYKYRIWKLKIVKMLSPGRILERIIVFGKVGKCVHPLISNCYSKHLGTQEESQAASPIDLVGCQEYTCSPSCSSVGRTLLSMQEALCLLLELDVGAHTACWWWKQKDQKFKSPSDILNKDSDDWQKSECFLH